MFGEVEELLRATEEVELQPKGLQSAEVEVAYCVFSPVLLSSDLLVTAVAELGALRARTQVRLRMRRRLQVQMPMRMQICMQVRTRVHRKGGKQVGVLRLRAEELKVDDTTCPLGSNVCRSSGAQVLPVSGMLCNTGTLGRRLQ